ncbi:peptidoglycan-binding protein [bacterium]|nr:peptidoglycan-binding protein [bacterium]
MGKKIFAFALALSISFWAIAPSANALTAEELQAQIDALLAQLAQLQAQLAALQGGTTAITGCTITSFDRNLSIGMTGDDVKCLQIVLNSDPDTKLADSGPGSPGNETSYFGPLTKAAVIKFQEKYASEVLAPWGLTSGTGFVGSTTRAKLNELLSAGAPSAPETPSEPQVTTGEFSVALAADTPAAGTIVADSDGAQALIPALKVTFSNGTDEDIKVTTLKVKRGGISADTDISQGYLYDEDGTKLAEYTSFTDRVMTFSDSSGLFTVPAGETKTITFKFDLVNDADSGKTIYFSIESADYITADGQEVSGSFPITGNTLTTASVSDLGKLTVATSTDPSVSVDPQDNFEVFNFTLQAQDQKIEIRKIKFTNMGSTAASDLKNFKLYDGGTQLLDTIADMASDKTVTFDFGDNPLVIDKGVTKNMHLRADIVGGTNRTFQFSIQEQTDIEAYDQGYGVYIKPNASGWTVLKATNASTINTGKLTLTRASDSPSGNIPLGGTNVSIAKFNIKASGEDVKISSLGLKLYGSIGNDGLYQVKIYFDGSQKGTTQNVYSSTTANECTATTYSFGNTFIVPADGEDHTIEIKADIKKASGSAYSGNETVTAQISSVTATGRDSLASVSSVSASGNQLTIKSGELSVAQNSAVGDWTETNPTGVPGQTEALVGAFIITAGASEGADITAIKITDDGTKGFGNLMNLKVYKGTKESGTQIGSTQSSLTVDSTYTFYPSPYISLNASEQLPIYVYADIKTGASTGSQGYVVIAEVDATGKTTNTDISYATDTDGQAIYIASAGSLTVAQGEGTPISANVIAGSDEPVSFTQTKFTAGLGEDIEVTRIVYTADLQNDAPTSSIYNISLWDGDTQIGSTLASLDSQGRAIFDLTSDPWIIPAGGEKNLMVKAYINEIIYATSGGSVALNINTSSANGLTAGITYKGAISGSTATTSAIYAGNPMYIYKTGVRVAANEKTPSGSQVPQQYAHVLYFDVTNLGEYTAYLNGVTTTISWSAGGGHATASEDRIFYLYDSSDLSTVLATTSISQGDDLNGAELTFNLSSAKAIPAGSTKTFYVIGDTRDGSTDNNNPTIAQFYIADGTDFNWGDGLSSAIETTRTFASPILGGVLSL